MRSIVSALTAAVLALSLLGGCGARSRTSTLDEARITPSPAATAPGTVGDAIGRTAEGVGDAVGRTVEGVGDAVGGVVEGAGRAVGGVVNGARDAADDMMDDTDNTRDGFVTDRDGIIGNETPAATATPNTKR